MPPQSNGCTHSHSCEKRNNTESGPAGTQAVAMLPNNTHTIMNVQSNQRHPAEGNILAQLRLSQIPSLICSRRSVLSEKSMPLLAHLTWIFDSEAHTCQSYTYKWLILAGGVSVFTPAQMSQTAAELMPLRTMNFKQTRATIATCLSVPPSLLYLWRSSVIWHSCSVRYDMSTIWGFKNSQFYSAPLWERSDCDL